MSDKKADAIWKLPSQVSVGDIAVAPGGVKGRIMNVEPPRGRRKHYLITLEPVIPSWEKPVRCDPETKLSVLRRL